MEENKGNPQVLPLDKPSNEASTQVAGPQYFEPSDSEADAEEEQGEEGDNGQQKAEASGEEGENEDERPPPPQSPLSKKARQKAKKKAKAAVKAAKVDEEDGEASKDTELPTSPPVEEDEDDKPSGKKGKGKNKKGKKNAKKSAKNTNSSRSLPQDEASGSTKAPAPEEKGSETAVGQPAESSPTDEANPPPSEDVAENISQPPAAEESGSSDPPLSTDPPPQKESDSEPSGEPQEEQIAEPKEESTPPSEATQPGLSDSSAPATEPPLEDSKESANLESETVPSENPPAPQPEAEEEQPASETAPGPPPSEPQEDQAAEEKDESSPPVADQPEPPPEGDNIEAVQPELSESSNPAAESQGNDGQNESTSSEPEPAPAQPEDESPSAQPSGETEEASPTQPTPEPEENLSAQPSETVEEDSNASHPPPEPETVKEIEENAPEEPPSTLESTEESQPPPDSQPVATDGGEPALPTPALEEHATTQEDISTSELQDSTPQDSTPQGDEDTQLDSGDQPSELLADSSSPSSGEPLPSTEITEPVSSDEPSTDPSIEPTTESTTEPEILGDSQGSQRPSSPLGDSADSETATQTQENLPTENPDEISKDNLESGGESTTISDNTTGSTGKASSDANETANPEINTESGSQPSSGDVPERPSTPAGPESASKDEIIEPESPSTKQVRFAENAEVIAEPSSQESGNQGQDNPPNESDEEKPSEGPSSEETAAATEEPTQVSDDDGSNPESGDSASEKPLPEESSPEPQPQGDIDNADSTSEPPSSENLQDPPLEDNSESANDPGEDALPDANTPEPLPQDTSENSDSTSETPLVETQQVAPIEDTLPTTDESAALLPSEDRTENDEHATEAVSDGSPSQPDQISDESKASIDVQASSSEDAPPNDPQGNEETVEPQESGDINRSDESTGGQIQPSTEGPTENDELKESAPETDAPEQSQNEPSSSSEPGSEPLVSDGPGDLENDAQASLPVENADQTGQEEDSSGQDNDKPSESIPLAEPASNDEGSSPTGEDSHDSNQDRELEEQPNIVENLASGSDEPQAEDREPTVVEENAIVSDEKDASESQVAPNDSSLTQDDQPQDSPNAEQPQTLDAPQEADGKESSTPMPQADESLNSVDDAPAQEISESPIQEADKSEVDTSADNTKVEADITEEKVILDEPQSPEKLASDMASDSVIDSSCDAAPVAGESGNSDDVKEKDAVESIEPVSNTPVSVEEGPSLESDLNASSATAEEVVHDEDQISPPSTIEANPSAGEETQETLVEDNSSSPVEENQSESQPSAGDDQNSSSKDDVGLDKEQESPEISEQPESKSDNEPSATIAENLSSSQPEPETIDPAESPKSMEQSGDIEPPSSPVDDTPKGEDIGSPNEQMEEKGEDTVTPSIQEDGADQTLPESLPEPETKDIHELSEVQAVQEEQPKIEETAPEPESEKNPSPEDDESKDILGPIPSTEQAAEKTDKGEDHSVFLHDTPGVRGNFVSNPIEESLLAEDVDDSGANTDFTEDSNALPNTAGLDGQTQSPPDEDEGGVQIASGVGSTSNNLEILNDGENIAAMDLRDDNQAELAQSTHDNSATTTSVNTEALDISTAMRQPLPLQADISIVDNITPTEDVGPPGDLTSLDAEASEGVPLSSLPAEEEISDNGVSLTVTEPSLQHADNERNDEQVSPADAFDSSRLLENEESPATGDQGAVESEGPPTYDGSREPLKEVIQETGILASTAEVKDVAEEDFPQAAISSITENISFQGQEATAYQHDDIEDEDSPIDMAYDIATNEDQLHHQGTVTSSVIEESQEIAQGITPDQLETVSPQNGSTLEKTLQESQDQCQGTEHEHVISGPALLELQEHDESAHDDNMSKLSAPEEGQKDAAVEESPFPSQVTEPAIEPSQDSSATYRVISPGQIDGVSEEAQDSRAVALVSLDDSHDSVSETDSTAIIQPTEHRPPSPENDEQRETAAMEFDPSTSELVEMADMSTPIVPEDTLTLELEATPQEILPSPIVSNDAEMMAVPEELVISEGQAVSHSAEDDVASVHSISRDTDNLLEEGDLAKQSEPSIEDQPSVLIAEETARVELDVNRDVPSSPDPEVQSPISLGGTQGIPIDKDLDPLQHSSTMLDSDLQSDDFVLVQKAEEPAIETTTDIEQCEDLQEESEIQSEQKQSVTFELPQDPGLEEGSAPSPVQTEDHASKEQLSNLLAPREEEIPFVLQSEPIQDELSVRETRALEDNYVGEDYTTHEEFIEDTPVQEPLHSPDSITQTVGLTQETSTSVLENGEPQDAAIIEATSQDSKQEADFPRPISAMDSQSGEEFPDDIRDSVIKQDQDGSPILTEPDTLTSIDHLNPEQHGEAENLQGAPEGIVDNGEKPQTFEMALPGKIEVTTTGPLPNHEEKETVQVPLDIENERDAAVVGDIHSPQQVDAAGEEALGGDPLTVEDNTKSLNIAPSAESPATQELIATEDPPNMEALLDTPADLPQGESTTIPDTEDTQTPVPLGLDNTIIASNSAEESNVMERSEEDRLGSLLEDESAYIPRSEPEVVHISADPPSQIDSGSCPGEQTQEEPLSTSGGSATETTHQTEKMVLIDGQEQATHEESVISSPPGDSTGLEQSMDFPNTERTEETRLDNIPLEIIPKDECAMPQDFEPLAEEESIVASEEDQIHVEPLDSINEPVVDTLSSVVDTQEEAAPLSPQPSLGDELVAPVIETEALEQITEDSRREVFHEGNDKQPVPEGPAEPVILTAVVEPETRDISESGLDLEMEEPLEELLPEPGDHAEELQIPIDTTSGSQSNQAMMSGIPVETSDESIIHEDPAVIVDSESLLGSSETAPDSPLKELEERSPGLETTLELDHGDAIANYTEQADISESQHSKEKGVAIPPESHSQSSHHESEGLISPIDDEEIVHPADVRLAEGDLASEEVVQESTQINKPALGDSTEEVTVTHALPADNILETSTDNVKSKELIQEVAMPQERLSDAEFPTINSLSEETVNSALKDEHETAPLVEISSDMAHVDEIVENKDDDTTTTHHGAAEIVAQSVDRNDLSDASSPLFAVDDARKVDDLQEDPEPLSQNLLVNDTELGAAHEVSSAQDFEEIEDKQAIPVLSEPEIVPQECSAQTLSETESVHEAQIDTPGFSKQLENPLQSQQQEMQAEEVPSSSVLPTHYSLEDLQAEPEVTPPPVESVRELIANVLEAVQEKEQSQVPEVKEHVPDLPVASTSPGQEGNSTESSIIEEIDPQQSDIHGDSAIQESPIIPPITLDDDYQDDHREAKGLTSTDATLGLVDKNGTPKALDSQVQKEGGSDDGGTPMVSREIVAEHATPKTLLQPEPQSQAFSEDVRSISPAEFDSPYAVEELVPLSESFTLVDKPRETDRGAPIEVSQHRPGIPRIDSGTQTDDLFRPKTPLQNLMKAAMSQEFRAPTPAIEIPDSEDPHAKQMSRARSVRRQRRRTIRNAEEIVAAAVVIYAAAEALSPPGSPPLASNLDKDLKKEEEPIVLSLSDSTSQGVVVENSTGEEAALRKSVADLLAEDKSRELKSDDKTPKSSHSSRRSSYHSSRPTRSRDGSKDATAKVPHHHHHHKRRADSEHSGRSGSEQGSPRTPKRQDSGFSSSHSTRSKKERTPEEQAAHDKRKEERRLAREKERLKDSSPSKSPSKSSKGKEPDADKSSSHRSSRRHSHASATITKEGSPVPPKKFFDMKNGQSVMESNFGPSVDKEIARPDSLQRSSTTHSANRGVRKSIDASRAKLQKAREEVAADAKEATAAESSDAGAGDTLAAGDEHRKNRQEKRQKESSKDPNKPGFRAAIKRFFTS